MFPRKLLPLLLAFINTVFAIPAPNVDSLKPPRPGMRLIKTAEDGEPFWVTEEQKFKNFSQKRTHFVDITETLELESHERERLALKIHAHQSGTFPSKPTRQQQAAPLISALSSGENNNLQIWATQMTSIYTRYFRSSTCAPLAANWMFHTAREQAAANKRITVTQFKHSAYNQPSVIVKIPGTTGKSVIVSAHYDSINSSSLGGRAPGADDNASGVVVLLDVLRVFAKAGYAPRNTLEFHFYSGEEGGLLGSRDIMQSYLNANTPVLALMNQDMTGYSPNNVIAVFEDFVSLPLTTFVKKLVPVYTSLPLKTDRCGYSCSDHGSAYAAGFPASYVCDASIHDASPYIHSDKDTLGTLNYDHMVEHSKFTVGFLVESDMFS